MAVFRNMALGNLVR